MISMYFFFFFQAEDGIRDIGVTGVQTCALPISSYTNPRLSADMLELMTNTSFEDRLPEPLPEETRVAHKIGSYGDTFSDAGIVFPSRLTGCRRCLLYRRDSGGHDRVEHPLVPTAYIPGYLPVARGAPRPSRK